MKPWLVGTEGSLYAELRICGGRRRRHLRLQRQIRSPCQGTIGQCFHIGVRRMGTGAYSVECCTRRGEGRLLEEDYLGFDLAPRGVLCHTLCPC